MSAPDTAALIAEAEADNTGDAVSFRFDLARADAYARVYVAAFNAAHENTRGKFGVTWDDVRESAAITVRHFAALVDDLERDTLEDGDAHREASRGDARLAGEAG